MKKGKLKKVFPGGNTSQGFVSLYHNIIEPDATRILVIKGGPGVGKSTFMRKIGETMLERGYDVEYHCCSSDNGSLDGVCIPAIKVAMLDGTAPHVVDPKNPGAVDEIIHLGDFWDEEKMRANKDLVLESNARVGRLFQIAYSNLREAKVIHDEWKSYITESMTWPKVNEIANSILTNIFQNITPQYQQAVRERHLFGSAISPQGPVHYYETILQDVENLYLLKGEPGTGKSTILKKAVDQASLLGLDTEVFNQPFDPGLYDVVVIPSRKTALLVNTEPLHFDPSVLPSLKFTKEYNLDDCINQEILQKYLKEVADAKVRFWRSFNRAVEYVGQAKAVHDEMENYYIPAMDFDAINAKRDETMNRVLAWAAEFDNADSKFA